MTNASLKNALGFISPVLLLFGNIMLLLSFKRRLPSDVYWLIVIYQTVWTVACVLNGTRLRRKSLFIFLLASFVVSTALAYSSYIGTHHATLRGMGLDRAALDKLGNEEARQRP